MDTPDASAPAPDDPTAPVPPTGPVGAPAGEPTAEHRAEPTAEHRPEPTTETPAPPIALGPVGGGPVGGGPVGGWMPPTPPPPGPPQAPWAPTGGSAWGPITTPYGLAWGPQPIPPPPAPARGRPRFFAVTAMTVALSVVAGIGLGYAVWSPAASPAQNALSHNGAANGGSGSQSDPGGLFPNGSGSGSSGSGSSGSGNPAATTAIAAKVDPALVDINVVLSYQDESAAGTGQVLTSSGLVLTNNHVVDEATSISATDIGNGKTYSASVVGYDRTGDLAVIQLHNASGLSTVTIGDSSKVSVGQSIVAIGNAGGVGGTPSVAAGSVTTLNQAITASDDDGGNAEQLTGLIEVNADVQPGDSGGPLVNSSGDVVGIDTAAAETSFSDSTGDGYAIPINTAISVAKEIEAGKGSSTIHIGPTAFLGVGISSGSSSFGGLGGNLGGSTVDGADVQSVAPGSPAEQAGLAVGDVITSVAGQAVTSSASLSTIIGSHVPGDSVVVQWEDAEGNSHSATVQLASGPAT